MKRLLLLALGIPCIAFAQIHKDYQGLLWKISGNDLEEPSYLYGTMHVSNRVAFHLGDPFFDAIEKADIIALEINPETWVRDLTTSPLYHDFFSLSWGYSKTSEPLYTAFVPNQPQQTEWEYYLSRDQDLLNTLLYRLDQFDQDFAENTYLDLFIYQAGKKKGKDIIALEDFQESFKYTLLADKQDEDVTYITDRQARELLGDFTNWQLLMEDAYRRGDLDLIDTINSVLYPGKYHRRYMLDERNLIMVNGMDSLMKQGVVFTGVGAAHLPGKMGVINLLRDRGYTVETIGRGGENQIERKEEIDDIIYTTPSQNFTSDDGYVQAQVPGEMIKLLSQPYQEYVYADMVNGSFYSIRRINTFGAVYGKTPDDYRGKLDSLLFENIPGKILSKEAIKISGFPALDVRNETRTGDHQHYQIVCSPLEVIIFKVGGNKEFANSDLPENFFNSIRLNSAIENETYAPRFNGFEVNLPGETRTEGYEGAFENPHQTFWAQSFNEGDYYAAGMRQYHDFEYIEDDEFELTYMVESIAEEKDFEIDTLYISGEGQGMHSVFELLNERGDLLYGKMHIQGPKYVFLLTTSDEEAKRNAFFDSFAFTPWKYADDFKTYTDTAYHVVLNSPTNTNNHVDFLNGIYRNNRGFGSDSEDFEGEAKEKIVSYLPTGEQVKIQTETLHAYYSCSDLETFWDEQKLNYELEHGLEVISDSILYTKKEENYLSEAREIRWGTENGERIIKSRFILENGALYSIWACSDQLGYESKFVEEAFSSFKPAGDTIIGVPITHRKADKFFEALDSRDSTLVAQARESVSVVDFEKKDLEKIKSYIRTYEQEGFNREARLDLLEHLTEFKGDEEIDFLADYYYEKIDSAAYQFEILKALSRFQNKKGAKAFGELILDEPPFTSNNYGYSTLFYGFYDSLQLVSKLYPELLTLTDFEDYRSSIYRLLASLEDSGLVAGKTYRAKYRSILLFAKVELKKQHAKDADRKSYSSPASSNTELTNYTRLLTPFARKKEVREHFQNILSIRNERVLADLLQVIDPHMDVPDSVWNAVAENPKAFYKIRPYLKKTGQLNVLNSEFKTEENWAKALLLNSRYTVYDTVSFIQRNSVRVLDHNAEVFFFRAKREDDKLWKFMYVVVNADEEMDTHYILARDGEEYNEDIDDLNEIIEDALVEIKAHGRERVVDVNNFGRW